MSCLLGFVVCISVATAAPTCDVEKAIDELQECRNGMHKIQKELFNASDPDHVKEACCATGNLETCLHTAAERAGCHHEVEYLINALIQTTRGLLGDMYNANCWYDCNTGASHGPQVINALGITVVCLLLSLWRMR